MSVIDQEERISKLKKMDNPLSKELRSLVKGGTKNLKTQWITVAQTLVSIWRDKLYEYWGHEKFETYTQAELGIKKPMAMKMIKSYMFLENSEPQVLKPEFVGTREPSTVPDLDAINILRLVRSKDKLTREDYLHLRRLVLEKAVSASDVRRELKRILAEREEVDEDEIKRVQKKDMFKRLSDSLLAFKGRAVAFKWCKEETVTKIEELFKEIQDAI